MSPIQYCPSRSLLGMGGATTRGWTNWCGLETARPAQVLAPASVPEVVDSVVVARTHGLRLKMVGSGHSFTGVAVTDGMLLLPDRLVGIRSVDRDAMTVTVLAGTPLHVLNERLRGLGLALHNMGDVDRQTVAGAIATGTHGTGGRWASLSAQVAGLELVTADGQVRELSREREPELFDAARVGLGALGVVTAVTFLVEPAFLLEAVEEPMGWQRAVGGFDDLAGDNHHFEMYWFPHTDRLLTKRNNRTLDEPEPLSRVRAYVDDELLANTVFGLVNRLGNRVPRSIPATNQLAHGMAALTEVRRLIERSGWRVGFPVEVRHAPEDDVWLSAASGRDTVYLAFHVNAQTDHTSYFLGVEEVLKRYDGRPHWGKLHTRAAADLAAAYPRWEDFQKMRQELDPDRMFANAYLDRVLGA
jgi:L-gulono-1,4-lactone dehydrogenase